MDEGLPDPVKFFSARVQACARVFFWEKSVRKPKYSRKVIVLPEKLWYNIKWLCLLVRTLFRNGTNMIILGIDPGYAIIGFGVIRFQSNRYVPLEYGAICTEAGEDFSLRLERIYDYMTLVLE